MRRLVVHYQRAKESAMESTESQVPASHREHLLLPLGEYDTDALCEQLMLVKRETAFRT